MGITTTSFPMLMAAHTYWSTTFLGRAPILQYTGRHGAGEDSILAVEAVMDYQVGVGQHIGPLYNWLLDAGKYGIGILGMHWDKEVSTISRIVEEPELLFHVPTGRTVKRKITEDVMNYQGTRVFNIMPSRCLFDPRVPAIHLQKGEFFGFESEMNWNDIQRGVNSGKYFNEDQIQKRQRNAAGMQPTPMSGRESGQLEMPEMETSFGTHEIPDIKPIKYYEMYVELIPKNWGLGKGDKPTKWVFTVAENSIIIGARPHGDYHNKFPFICIETEFDPYSLFPQSMSEIAAPLQNLMDWLVNSHMHNVRKTQNDQFVVDPSRVLMKDVRDPNAGKLIRLRPEAYGSNPSDAIHQLRTVDVTQTHMKDTQFVNELFQRSFGVNDNIMGLVNTGGRKSATEVRSSNTFGTNRLKTQSEYFSATGYSQYAQIALQMTQQYYSGEDMFRIAGDLMGERTQKMVEVTPDSIAGFYDFIPVDGSFPVDRFAQANLWRQFIADASKIEGILQNYDIAGIFGWAARLGGLKNIDRFKIQVVPDEQAHRDAQAGNVVPVKENLDSIPTGRQISGIGPTG